jgi:FixJ family two-component response regulator
MAAPLVFLVDDDASVRKSLARLVKTAGYEAELFASVRDFLARAPYEGPCCLVLDVRMPGMSGLDLQNELQARKMQIPILIITGYAEVPLAVRAMKAGAFDFIEKPFSDQTLLDRIRAAVAHDDVIRKQLALRAEVRERMRLLTPRERDVAIRVVAGKSNKVIASELNLSTKTVEVHRAHVMEKLQVTCLADLIRMFLLANEDGDAPTA